MTKKINQRSQRKAQKKANQRNRRNTWIKEQKRLEKMKTESFEYQIGLWFADINNSIRKVKSKINMKMAKFKFWMREPLLDKMKLYARETTLDDLIYTFATREHISVALATVILCCSLGAINSQAVMMNDESFIAVSTTQEPRVTEETVATVYLEQRYDDMYDFLSENKIEELEEIIIDEPPILTNAQMFDIVCDKYGVEGWQLNEIIASVLEEGGKSLVEDEKVNYYDNCYEVASVFLNRISSASCINFVNNQMGPGTGTNIYQQLICPGQFTVDRATVKALAQTDMSIYDGYAAVIKLFYTSNPSHDYYRFVAPRLADNPKYAKYKPVQLSPHGNYFFWEVRDSDRVDPADLLPNYGKYMTDEYLAAYAAEGVDEIDEGAEESNLAIENGKRLAFKPLKDSTEIR